MKNKFFIIILFICLYFVNCDVFAASKDVQAVFKQSYNVELVTDTINNDKISLTLDDMIIEVSSSETNLKVVLIKASDEANDYAKSFTSNDDNYYLVFYKNGQKINTNTSVVLKTKDKVLNVYNNNGKLMEKSDELISLNGNDYFLILTDYINVDNTNYKIVDIDETIDDIDDIENNDSVVIDIYNSKDVKIEKNGKLGTNYKVVATKNGVKSTYIIIAKGDTTGDAKISLNDVTRLYHHYKGLENMDEVFILAGDVAKNDLINLNDVTKIYHFYKGIIPEL